MLVTLSERKTSDLIRRLENIPDQTHEEIMVRIKSYAKRLFDYVYNDFGLRMLGLKRQSGAIGIFQFELLTSDREKIVAGLNFLEPVAITVEKNDLPHLILNSPMLAAAREAWYDELAPQFLDILPGELLDKIEQLVPAIAFRGEIAAPSDDPGMAAIQESQFQNWCIENGLPVPGEQHRKADEFRLQEELAVEQAQQAKLDEFMSRRAE